MPLKFSERWVIFKRRKSRYLFSFIASHQSVKAVLRKDNHLFSIIAIFVKFGLRLVYWGLTPQQQPGSYQGHIFVK